MDKKTQSNYTICLANNQLSLPLEIFTSIPEDDPVNLLNAILEKVDYSIFDAAYSRLGRIEYSPRILTKVLVYGYMRKCYSSRDMALACRENIKFRYLLEGQNPPSHNTINRFRSQYLPPVHEQLFQQICRLFHQAGYLSLEQVFIDGTKIEGNANKYSFVWKKSSEKRLKKLQTRIYEELPALLQEAGIHFRVPEKVQIRHLKKILKKLAVRREKEQIEFVYGKGKRKTSLQRTTEKVTEWLDKMKRYTQDLHICGNRNSYSKTDHDATFMHMKEDYMRNGQLKPGYNVNVATANGFIVGNYISSERSDVGTLIPFMDKLGLTSTSKIVVDSGYESEENYCYFEQSGKPDLYVKPSNHEQRKGRKYQTDISRRENMLYDEKADTYTCAAGKELILTDTRTEHTKTGFRTEKSIYSCQDCKDCPLKERCIRSKSKVPLEERSKTIYVSKRFARQRKAMEEKINTEEGKLLRVNRTIQAEGTFAGIKQDMGFRRFLLRGQVKVEVEWTLLSLANNIWRLYYKRKNRRLGTGLIIPKAFPAGL